MATPTHRRALQQARWSHGLALAAILIAAIILLKLLGRSWWCSAGDLNPWSADIVSVHNSQHLLDPYTLTHVLHGIGLYGLLWLLLRQWAGAISRGVLAIGLESVWEVIENTSGVIEKYREETMALGYYGDSILNSLADIAACALGYGLAMLLPFWVSFVVFFAIEALLLYWIRDSLLLNILMLIWPLEAVKKWQGG